jgi:hypothetical protein
VLARAKGLASKSSSKVDSKVGSAPNSRKGEKLKAENKVEATEKKETGENVLGATPVVAAEELDPGRERRPLESYFQEIGGTRTLKREEEVYLAKDLESATAALRDVLYAVPSSARHVVARWDALRALSHTGAKQSSDFVPCS